MPGRARASAARQRRARSRAASWPGPCAHDQLVDLGPGGPGVALGGGQRQVDDGQAALGARDAGLVERDQEVLRDHAQARVAHAARAGQAARCRWAPARSGGRSSQSSTAVSASAGGGAGPGLDPERVDGLAGACGRGSGCRPAGPGRARGGPRSRRRPGSRERRAAPRRRRGRPGGGQRGDGEHAGAPRRRTRRRPGRRAGRGRAARPGCGRPSARATRGRPPSPAKAPIPTASTSCGGQHLRPAGERRSRRSVSRGAARAAGDSPAQLGDVGGPAAGRRAVGHDAAAGELDHAVGDPRDLAVVGDDEQRSGRRSPARAGARGSARPVRKSSSPVS